MTETIIALIVLGLIVVLTVWYLFRAKRSGQKCIGCPHSKACTGSCGGQCASKKSNPKK